MNMAVSNNPDDIEVAGNKISYGKKTLIELPILKLTKKKYDPSNVEALEIGHRLLSESVDHLIHTEIQMPSFITFQI